jgi:hypothetical protein
MDLAGAITAATSLAGLAYGFTAWAALGPTSSSVLAALIVGVAGMVAFLLTEHRSPHPMLPLKIFANKAFTAANLVTFTVYAALGGVFFLVVLNLQVVAGFSPIPAGAALLPVTLLMLALPARASALAQRIGPRLPMTIGPIVCAGAMVELARIGAHTSYLRQVLPAVVVLGLGLALTVAPLTATALGSIHERHTGLASGVNNTVARTAGLLAVAVLPLAGDLRGTSLTNPTTLAPAYHTAMLLCAALLLAGAATAAIAVPTSLPAHDWPPPTRPDGLLAGRQRPDAGRPLDPG